MSHDRLPRLHRSVLATAVAAMIDFHDEQFVPRTACSGKNCASATVAVDVYFGTRGAAEMTTEEVRHLSGISCVPGVDTPSGGINIPAIERICKAKGVTIDFGPGTSIHRWSASQVKAYLSSIYGGHLIGMYSSVKAPWRAHGSTFQGGHSVFVHDWRDDKPDSHFKKVQATVCWHDPLRERPIRVPTSVVIAYTQTASPLKGLIGWVKIPPIPGGTYAKPFLDRTRTAYATTGVHRTRTKGKASTVRVIRGKGTMVQLAMYAPGETYKGSNQWGALSLIGDEWVAIRRLTHVGGKT